MGAYGSQLFLQIDNALDVVLLKLGLVCHDIVIGTDEVLLQLIVESLSTDLHANAKNYLNVNNLFFKGGLKDAKMPFARFFDRVVYLVLCRHNLIQVDLVVQKVVINEPLERF